VKWILAILSVLGGWLSGGVVGGFAAGLTGFWEIPGAGIGAAFVTVVVAYLAAPSHKLISAFVVLAVGALLAWLVLEPSSYPSRHYHENAYEDTHLPIIVTYISAILGFALVAMLTALQRRRCASAQPGMTGVNKASEVQH